MQVTRSNIDRQAARTQENMRHSMEAVAHLQAELATAGQKYSFLQQLKGYIADLCDMLQVSHPMTQRSIASIAACLYLAIRMQGHRTLLQVGLNCHSCWNRSKLVFEIVMYASHGILE